MTTISGQLGISIFTAKVVASGLRLYAATGMKPNSAYTPTNMLRVASEYTGQKFKRGQYIAAAEALDKWVEERRSAAIARGDIR